MTEIKPLKFLLVYVGMTQSYARRVARLELSSIPRGEECIPERWAKWHWDFESWKNDFLFRQGGLKREHSDSGTG